MGDFCLNEDLWVKSAKIGRDTTNIYMSAAHKVVVGLGLDCLYCVMTSNEDKHGLVAEAEEI